MLAVADAGARGASAQRAKPGPGAGHGLGRSRPARLQLPAQRGPGGARDRAARAARPAARRSSARRGASTASGSPRSTTARRRERRSRRPRPAVRRTAARSAAAGSSTRSACRPAPTATPWSPTSSQRGVEAKAYMPSIHLMGLLPRALRLSRGPVPGRRGRLGAPAGAAVLPGAHRGQIDRVCEALAEALRGDLELGMPRFDDPPDPLFARLNASLGFDRRLWPQDIEGSRAHVGALDRAGVLADGERDALLTGLDAVAAELERGEFAFRAGRRGHPHGDRAPADRARRAGRRQAPHGALAQRPGGDRPGAVRPRALRAGDRADSRR